MPKYSKTNRYVPRHREEVNPFEPVKLEWELGTAIYARQSREVQKHRHKGSAEMQGVELRAWAISKGAPDEEHITVLYDENLDDNGNYIDASGTLGIERRERLMKMCQGIAEGRIKVVVVFMVDRLFRDQDMVGPTYFAKLCKDHDCKVVTYAGMIFNFAIGYHRDQFFAEAKMAADYLGMMNVRLHGLKMYMSRQGLYDGRFISVGYIVDREEKLADGSPNPSYKHYIIYEPHAKIVRWIFVRFKELHGDLTALCYEVEAMNDGYIFPPFDSWVDKRNHKLSIGERDPLTHKRMPVTERGYRISKSGLSSILTNRDYLGEWHSEGQCVQKHNQTPIVEEELFFYAYNRLVPQTDGATPMFQRAKGAGIAMLDGIMTSPQGGCYVIHSPKGKGYQYYGVYEPNNLTRPKFKFTIATDALDAIFYDRLVYWIEQTPQHERKRKAPDPNKELEARLKQLKGQIAVVDDQLHTIEIVLNTITNPTLIKKKEAEYERLLARKESLETESHKPAPKNVHNLFLKWEGFLYLLRETAFWEEMDMLQGKGTSLKLFREMAEGFTTKIELSQMSPHWFCLDIEWLHHDWGHERAYIYKRYGSTPKWEEEEIALLIQHYAHGEKDMLLKMFPKRNWQSISGKAQELPIMRLVHSSASDIPDALAYNDWQFMAKEGLTLTKEEAGFSVKVYWSRPIHHKKCRFSNEEDQE